MKVLLFNSDYLIIKNNNRITIHILSLNKLTFVDCGLRIAFTISDCAYSLKELAYTPDLQDYWQTTMQVNNYIGTSFLLQYFNATQDVLEGCATEQLAYEMLDFLATRYLRLWELINLTFTKIKPYIKECPESAEELFLKIVKYERMRSFEIFIEDSYVEYSPTSLSKFAEEMSHESPDPKVIKRFIPAYTRNNTNSLLFEVLKSCYKISRKKNRNIALAGETYNLATRYFWESVFRFTKARKRTGHQEQKSFIYQNGEIL